VLVPVVVIAAGLLLWRRRLELAALVVVAWAGAIAVYNVTKPIVDRQRPPASIRLSTAAGASFPSGHATQSLATYAALAIVVALLCRRGRVIGWVAAGLVVVAVGWSRVYLGMHWATDVASGWLFAGVWVVLMAMVVRPLAALVRVGGGRGLER
jgi:undecaprenyl-diphosphatase